MLAGATGIDFALLVVAADDGVMPQTVEHLEILDLLGVARGAVALTKIDRVAPERVRRSRGCRDALLAGTAAGGRRRCSRCRRSPASGVPALLDHLRGEAARIPRVRRGACSASPSTAASRSPAPGTVVTGTVFAGSVRVGDELVVSPSGRKVRVRSIHAQNRPGAGGAHRRALRAESRRASRRTKCSAATGSWRPRLHAPSTRFDARLRLLPGAPRRLKHWTPVHVHLGAAHLHGARRAARRGRRAARRHGAGADRSRRAASRLPRRHLRAARPVRRRTPSAAARFSIRTGRRAAGARRSGLRCSPRSNRRRRASALAALAGVHAVRRRPRCALRRSFNLRSSRSPCRTLRCVACARRSGSRLFAWRTGTKLKENSL